MPRYINPVPGYTYPSYGKLYFYKTATNTALTTYKDELETTPNANPVLLDALGRVPNTFYTGKARVVLHDANDEQVWERDPAGGEGALGDFEVYDEAVSYEKDDITKTADGIFYISIQNENQGNSPILNAGSNAYWMQISFIDIYNSSKSYTAGNVVQTSEGYLWRSVTSSNSGNSPLTNDGTNWLPAINGAKVTEIIELKRDTTTVIPQTGGGALSALRVNELQDGNTGYTLPLANTVSANQTMTITQPDKFKTFQPVVTRAGSDTISYSGGTGTSITLDLNVSISIVLTSNGSTDWRI